jgi:hypothetical protein
MKQSVKYLILSALFLFMTSAYTQAQDRKFNFGIHIAPNVSWIKPDVDGGEFYKYEGDGARFLMGYGADFNYFFIDNIGIGTGVNVVYNGGNLKYPTVYYPTDPATGYTIDTIESNLYRKYKLQYLEVPLVLIGSTGDLMGKFSIYGKFGIGTSFKLKARADDVYKVRSTPDISYTQKNTDISKQVLFIKESMIIGVGGTYKFAKVISINFGLNFNSGFTNIFHSAYNEEVELKYQADNNIKRIQEKGKASYIELYAGILF